MTQIYSGNSFLIFINFGTIGEKKTGILNINRGSISWIAILFVYSSGWIYDVWVLWRKWIDDFVAVFAPAVGELHIFFLFSCQIIFKFACSYFMNYRKSSDISYIPAQWNCCFFALCYAIDMGGGCEWRHKHTAPTIFQFIADVCRKDSHILSLSHTHTKCAVASNSKTIKPGS